MADHRWPAKPREVEAMAVALAQALGAPLSGKPGLSSDQHKAVQAIAKDVSANRGQSLFVAGRWQSAVVHAITHWLNVQFGSVGKTVRYGQPVEARAEKQTESIKALTSQMAAGQVETLLVLGGNPAFDAPADLGFGKALAKVKNKIHCGLYIDETAAL